MNKPPGGEGLSSNEPTAVYTVGDFVRRVVDSLLRGDHRGTFFCARCLLKLTRDHLDKSYAKADVATAIGEMFDTPGTLTHAASSICGSCGRRKVPCLGVPPPG